MSSSNGTEVPPAPMFVHPGPGGDRGPPLPKRFYTTVSVVPHEAGFALQLDGRNTRTPARRQLVLPTPRLAEAVLEEWTAVAERIDPRRMPFTRLANSAIDGVGQSQDAVMADVLRYTGSDLLVYRAGDPQRLVDAQSRAWDPIVAWSRDVLGAPLVLAEGVVFVQQPAGSLQRLAEVVKDLVGDGRAAPFRLAGLHVMTTLTSSVLLAAAVASGRLGWAEAWAAAHVDEDFQIGEWGGDAEAEERREKRAIDMRVAAEVYELSR